MKTLHLSADEANEILECLDHYQSGFDRETKEPTVLFAQTAFDLLHNKVKAQMEPHNPEEFATAVQYREAAERLHGIEGECEIDGDAVVSFGDSPGAYVQAWVWVPKDAL